MCPKCGAPMANAYVHRLTKKSQLTVYRRDVQGSARFLHSNTPLTDDHDDGDGIREVHCNTAEGMWTGCPQFSAPV